jgi:Poly(A) polymerase catalytic subunit
MFSLFKSNSVLLDEIVKKHNSGKEIKLYNENIELFEIVKEFIVKNDLILYGGTALNMLLPKRVKFYSKYSLPDYDVFCTNAREKGIELARLFKEKGYKYIELKDAIHPGTYKLFINFLPAMDLTNVPAKFYKYMHNNSTKDVSTEMLICPVEILKWSLHIEMASPESSSHRWEKLFKRLIIINRNIKLNKKTVSTEISTKYESAYDSLKVVENFDKNNIKEIINIINELNDVILIGDYAFQYYTKLIKNIKLTTELEVLSKNPKELIDVLKDKYKNIEIKKTNKIFEIIPEKYKVFLNNTLILVINTIPENKCYSFKKIKNMKIGTIDTILAFYYTEYVNLIYKNKNIDDILRQILFFEYIVNLFYKNPKARFDTQCIGENLSLIEEMKKNWDLKIKKFVFRP